MDDKTEREQEEAHEARIRKHAEALWQDAGRPAGGPEAYRERAEELAAIEENYRSALKPIEVPGPYGEPIEEVVAMENEGEFPTLTDQGEEQTFPDPVPGDVAEEGRVIRRRDDESTEE